MGQTVSEMRSSTSDDAVKEQLDFLVKVANFKLDKYQHELERSFTERESTGKREVPGMRALRWSRGYRVDVSEVEKVLTPKAEADPQEPTPMREKPKQEPTLFNDIQEIITSFFGLDKPDESEKAAIRALTNNVHHSLKYIIHSQTVAEQEDKKFFVFMLNNAVVRIDVCVWKYNFISKKVLANSQNVLCYMLCLSVVDHRDLKHDELVYLLSEYTGTARETLTYSNSLTDLWNSVHHMSLSLPAVDRDIGSGISQIGVPRIVRPASPLPGHY